MPNAFADIAFTPAVKYSPPRVAAAPATQRRTRLTLRSLVVVFAFGASLAAAQPLDLGGFKVWRSVRVEPGDALLTLQGGEAACAGTSFARRRPTRSTRQTRCAALPLLFVLGRAEVIEQDPQQRHLWLDIDAVGCVRLQ